jgi:putative acetyltransferase
MISRTIRAYEAKDLDDVMASWESANKIAHPFLNAEFQAKVRHDIPNLYLPNADTWVIEDEGQVSGFLALSAKEIGGLFVKSEFHGTGAGKALTDKAHELHDTLVVDVFEKNIIGQKFYTRYGFTLLEKKIHEETGEKVIRLKFDSKINQSKIK